MRTDIEKRKRHELIKQIIQKKPIATQEELVAEIKALEVEATQTTVSRDLEEMQVGKWNGRYHIPLGFGDTPAWFQTIRQHVISMKKIGDHLIVLKIKDGSSSILEKALNDLELSEIAGVVASQNTIMIAFETTNDQEQLLTLLNKALS